MIDHARPGAAITFSLDVEQDGGDIEAPTGRLLDFLDAHAIVATCFVTGEVSAASPRLVSAMAARGHEIGSHGHVHRPLPAAKPAGFTAAMRDARHRLADLAGAPVIGYRAPLLSLTRASLWAADALAEAGFAYSASVLPGRGGLRGFPAAPRRPFLWRSGLLELPCPVFDRGPFAFPYLGGTALRTIPGRRFRQLIGAIGDPLPWTYVHPYDVAVGAGWNGTGGVLTRMALRIGRRLTLPRLAMLAGRAGPCFAARLEAARAMAAPWDPDRRPRNTSGKGP